MVRQTVSAARASDPHAAFETALLAVGFLVLLLVLPHSLEGDDYTRFGDIEQLIHHGHVTDRRYSMVGPLASAPLALLGEVVGSPVWWVVRFNAFLVAAALVAAYVLTRGRISPRLFRTFALVLLFASFLTDGLRYYKTEIFSGVLFTLGCLALATGRYRRLGWLALVLAVVNTPAAIVALCLVALVCAFRTRQLRPLLGPFVALALIMVEAWIRRGSPLSTGYEGDHGVRTLMPYSGKAGFSYPFLLGLVSILFSFGRGLVFFTPGLLLWLSPRTRRIAPATYWVVLQLLVVAGLVLIYAKWWAWYGGDAWGPRFFLVATVPASYLIAVRLRAANTGVGDALITLVILALSAWVGVTGMLENSWRVGFCSNFNYKNSPACWYVPDFSGLWWPIIHHPPPSARNVALVGFCVVVFVYLAAAPVRDIARGLARLHPETWAHGWRF